jgi:hypothetical protein
MTNSSVRKIKRKAVKKVTKVVETTALHERISKKLR